ncbi:MAG: ABC transporter substrate-binding protein [Gammaproteobacteria bacterium]|nr:ABC transporter substrate-binding protein [Gammaproteobacteria bacterium]
MLHRLAVALVLLLSACGERPWNDPYPAQDAGKSILYSAFSDRPKHLDPARSYSSNEVQFTAQIYEPPLQYHYLKRPYTLIPLGAAEMPQPVFLDRNGRTLPGPSADVAYSVYEIRIRPGVFYQPHPAFARDASGRFLYHNLDAGSLEHINTLGDFAQTGTRELVAADYVYQIKRLAHPRLHSPILGVMADYIVGLKEYAGQLEKVHQARSEGKGEEGGYLDLNQFALEGAQVVDRHTYRIKVRGQYPQLLYWLAMPFFAPVPEEAERFYSQPGLEKKNITLDWYPVGTGPYMLTVNNPNRQMVLERNPNFHGEHYPAEGESEDRAKSLLADAGKPLPFIDKVVFSLEKESIPYWNKFLQGYYDASGISSDSFDQAVRIGGQGEVALTDDMQARGIKLSTSVETSTFYMGFNMLDPVAGGYTERARKLRQAVSIAIDHEEYISIFTNGRGIAAQGPVPPGIFGYQEGAEGVNPYVYAWRDGRPQRKPIEEARRLLAEAGYPDGRDEKTGKPLQLYLDITASGPDDKSLLDWYRKQLQKLNVELVIRNTDYNRFQEKMLKGDAQLFIWGWNADYPDPENFLFLLYGPNAKVGKNGENAANYDNPEFNRLFEQMKNMENGPQRLAIIKAMVDIARRDAPWIWGLHPKRFTLYHSWYFNAKPNLMANNTLKYLRVDPRLREEKRAEWNRPIVWPFVVIVAILLLGTVPAVIVYLRREYAPPKLPQSTG